MAFARIVTTTALFFFSLFGALYLVNFFLPFDLITPNYIYIVAGYISLFFSLGTPAFVVRLADKNTKFKEIVIACLAFVSLVALEDFSYIKDYEQFVFSVFLLTVFSVMFSLFGFTLAEKIRGGSTKKLKELRAVSRRFYFSSFKLTCVKKSLSSHQTKSINSLMN